MSSLFSLTFPQNCLGTANLHFHNKQPAIHSLFKFPLLTVELLQEFQLATFKFQPIIGAVRMSLIPSFSVLKLLSSILLNLADRRFSTQNECSESGLGAFSRTDRSGVTTKACSFLESASR